MQQQKELCNNVQVHEVREECDRVTHTAVRHASGKSGYKHRQCNTWRGGRRGSLRGRRGTQSGVADVTACYLPPNNGIEGIT